MPDPRAVDVALQHGVHRTGRGRRHLRRAGRQETHFVFPEDLALARVPDTQGLGGASAMRSAGRT
jgi:hypothetical protein